MCTYLTQTVAVTASGYSNDEWLDVDRAVVSFDHPERTPFEHALRIDLRTDDPARRMAIELDASSARRLADAIISMLDNEEVLALR